MLFHDLAHETVQVRYLYSKMHPVVLDDGCVTASHEHMVLIQVPMTQVQGLPVLFDGRLDLRCLQGILILLVWPQLQVFPGIILRGALDVYKRQPLKTALPLKFTICWMMLMNYCP